MSKVTIGLYNQESAVLREYDPRAAHVADRVRQLLTSRLPMVIVEHIGSTAVPGCPGKGIVDLMIVYPAGQLPQVKDLLDLLGFQRQSTRDPFPEDRPMRLGSIEHDGTTFRLHVHVIAPESAEGAELRRFRDRLRAEPDLRDAYIRLKREILARGITDSVDYAYAKAAFFKDIQ